VWLAAPFPGLSKAGRRRLAQSGLVAVALLPLAALAVGALLGALGANPIETVTHTTGDWALRFLLASLAVTPARQLLGLAWLAPYRRTLGLLAFGYASLHFLTWIGLDLFFSWDAVREDALERPFVAAGLLAFALMLPLAVTSTRGWIRSLGRRWNRLHRLAYGAGIAACVHFVWLVKADLLEPAIYAGVLFLLLGARAVRAVRSRIPRSLPR
jgi:sulfoxide reductase heme-binding subunit YedZ